MRLICPNCDAQYEVDDGAIPVEGRDVQCSNCGHAWFQTHAMAMAGDDADDLVTAPVAPMTADPAPVAPPPPRAAHPEPRPDEPRPVELQDAAPASSPQPVTPSAADAAVPVAGAAPVRRTLDDNLLAVLREEAAREAAERRADAPRAIETQPDLGLPETGRRAPVEPPAPVAAPMPDHPVTERPTTRRDLLPDIEEINSTLRPGSDARDEEQPELPPLPPPRGGFRSGFGAMLLVAAVLVGLYVLAPQIAGAIPSMEGAMTSYVATVDALRVWLDSTMNAAAGALRGLTGEG
jgi:predicted Zn finger-like uncharacterized protein